MLRLAGTPLIESGSTWDGIMIASSRWVPVLLILLFLNMWVGQTKCAAATPQRTHVPVLLALNTFSGERTLPNGIEVYSGKAMVQVVALRDDVIRVRIARDGVLPEDASWAVLPSARGQRVNVIPETSDAAVGFRTRSLRVRIERTTLRLSLADL